ncbi:hypothetical protein [Amycolatopsis japonica]
MFTVAVPAVWSIASTVARRTTEPIAQVCSSHVSIRGRSGPTGPARPRPTSPATYGMNALRHVAGSVPGGWGTEFDAAAGSWPVMPGLQLGVVRCLVSHSAAFCSRWFRSHASPSITGCQPRTSTV